MKKIRILRIIARLNIGGPAIQAVLLTGALNNDEFESILVAGPVEKGEAEMSSLLSKHNVAPVFMKEIGREIRPVKDIKAFFKICALIKKYRPHVIHTHTAKAGTLGRLAAFFLRVPVRVHTFHGHTFYGYFNPLKNFIFLNIERLLSSITDKIITISPLQLSDVTARYKAAPRKRCIIMPLGIELGKYLKVNPEPGGKENIGFGKEDIIIGTVGRLTGVKNHKFFLETADLFYRTIKDERIKFAIVGDGKLKNELMAYRDALGLAEKVRIFGWQEDLARFYSAFDVFTLTSKNEGTPVSAIEAMASARPVVATDVGGLSDLVREGETGFLIKPGKHKEFVEKLKELIYNRGTSLSMGKAGRDSVKEVYSIKRLINDIIVLYKQTLKKKGAI